jgi:hypothetical protein
MACNIKGTIWCTWNLDGEHTVDTSRVFMATINEHTFHEHLAKCIHASGITRNERMVDTSKVETDLGTTGAAFAIS